MSFTTLPNELLKDIIEHTMPEGFESLALTCKHIHALCTPFIEHHNWARCYLQRFSYDIGREGRSDDARRFLRPYSFGSAFDLLRHIAVDPVAARYIEEAMLRPDGRRARTTLTDTSYEPRDQRRESIATLLADSRYLKEAGLDPEEYHSAMREEWALSPYSHHAAAFLLTLLPNLKVLNLPRYWTPSEAINRLLIAIINRARGPHLSGDRPSLARVTVLYGFYPISTRDLFDLDWTTRLLALPSVRSFTGRNCVGVGMNYGQNCPMPKLPFHALEDIQFRSAMIDEVAIAEFLKQTPRLKRLKYTHSTREHTGPQDWDLCGFVTAIQREVGSHLIQLSIKINKLSGSILPGMVSMRNFQRLEKLTLPVEMVRCNLSSSESAENSLDYYESSLNDIIPASVSHFRLNSYRQGDREKLLDFLFHDFEARKHFQVPALESIVLDCVYHPTPAVTELSEKLVAAGEKVGVTVDVYDASQVRYEEEWP